jgi:ERCC4-type nuclease
MASIILDYREHGLIELIPSATRDNLLIGDIHIKYQDYEFILERKTIADLISSVKDGRYKEQKIRLVSYMKENPSNRRIAYILEGDPYAIANSFYTETDKNTVIGFLVSSNLRDGIPVFYSKDRYSTQKIIEKLSTRLMKDTKDFFPIHQAGGSVSTLDEPYTTTIKMKKKENLNPSAWWILSLAQIPGVSHSIAEMIITTYPTIESLFLIYQNQDTPTTNKELLLAELRKSSSDSAKKIGKVLSTRIYQYLMNIMPTPEST